MRLLARLRKKRSETKQTDSKQPQPKHDESLRSSPEKPDVKATRKEKWIIRKRQADGTLKHLKTLTFRPTKGDLEAFGPGEYSVQKSAGGKFSKSERITIDGTPHEPRSRGLPALDQGLGQPEGRPTTNYHRPSGAPKELPSPSTTPQRAAGREKTFSDAIKRPSPQVKSDRPCSTDDRSRLSSDDGMKQEVESIVKTIRTLLDPEVKSASAVEAKGKSAIASKRETEKRESARSSTGRLQSDSQPERRTVDAHSASPSEDVRVRDGSKVPSQAPTTNSALVPEPTEEKKYISCAKCNDTICEEDELWLFKYDGKRCEYCGKPYCHQCYEGHLCSSSKLCAFCGKRFSNDFLFVAQYCRKTYCSQQCVNLCFEKNKDRSECWGCGDREEDTEEETEEDTEDAEESDQDESDQWDLHCEDCGISIEHDDRSNYVCMDCKDKDSFCSRLCFNRYHRRKGWDHEGMTFGEYDDLPEERSRKSKVRVIRKRSKVRVIRE